jgi:ribonuclease VapC
MVEPATAATARRVAAIYLRWGKGYHPARLNFADCFAYDVAKQHACPLLFVGDDFSRTDIQAALTA